MTTLLCTFAAGRLAIGLAPFVAAGPAAAALGFPAAHDTPTARLMARLFGVRDAGLGVLALAAAAGTVPVGFAVLFNLGHDLADAVAAAVPLVGRHGIDRGALTSLGFALVGASAWVALYAVLP
jgi:hypothetical protein